MKESLLLVLLIFCVLTACVIIPASVAAEEAGEGGEFSIPADTPVTYGYLEKFREQLKNEIIEELLENGGVKITSQYEDISLPQGGVLLLAPDSEVIYRGGGAVAITSSSRSGDGITDMSDGTELFSGTALKYGHIYFASESDAEKAILITGGTAYFTVRGSYETH